MNQCLLPFSYQDEAKGIDLTKVSRLDTLVTVVDCFNFIKDCSGIDTLKSRELTTMPQESRTIVNLLIDQVEFANVIILNKTDLVKPEDLGMLKSIIKTLNGGAVIIQSSFGKIDIKQILNTGLFDFEKISQDAVWIEALSKKHTPEADEYGINSFVFRDKRPFHPARFWKYLNNGWHGNIIRSKGMFWLASRPGDAMNWSQAGGSLRADKAGIWWCSLPYHERIRYAAFADNQKEIEGRWDKHFGDRHNELVIIGQDMEKDTISRELQQCLCTEEEIGHMVKGIHFADPFPVFQ